MAFPILTVDAFTAEPFRGNPAAVCLLPSPRDDAWMQAVAAEMNLAETAFLHPESTLASGRGSDGRLMRLRWFTPKLEVDLCGHATLAAAHVLWDTGRLPANEIARFQTRSGLLTAAKRGDEIELDFPVEPATAAEAPAGLLEALGAKARFVGRNRMDWLVEVDSEATLRALAPDFVKLKPFKTRGVIVTSPSSTTGIDFVSRFFAPAAGIDEDPVTGSAHCCLAPFWSQRLKREELVGYQASARGGVVRTKIAGARVLLSGRAVIVVRGELAGS
jgi:PhzF family phenazine biosynthesis protein